MIEHFQYVLDNYNNGEKKVNSSSKLYDELINKIPQELNQLLGRNDFKIKASMGNGNKAEIPWVAIMNKNITESTTRGLYIVYLFKKDLTGFYITLNQGITNFERLYKSKKYENAVKVANYFKSQVEGESSFSSNEIHLGSKKGDLGYGYEKANVLSKYYSSNNFTESLMKQDLEELVDVYDFIMKHMTTRDYDQIIKDTLADEESDFVYADEAIDMLKEVIDPDNDLPFGFIRELQESDPMAGRTHKFEKIIKPKMRKIDYEKKTKRDAKVGKLGETLALSYEQNRLTDLGRPDLAQKVKWVSVESDTYGYDIESYDIDSKGNVKNIRIEVKTTSSRVDTEFFVSKNEVETSIELKKNYCVFRIYDVNSQNPKFYKAFGQIEDNFILDPITYSARYKGAQA